VSYLEQKAIITILPPVARGSAGERLLARRSCARAAVAGHWPVTELRDVLEMLGLEDAG
jgi:hypothetical protein